jgi:hypothetical protein
MQDLQLIGVHEDGEHLLLSGADGGRFQLPVDEALRAAIRRDRPRLGQQQIEIDGGLRPRDVQALIRAGASAEEVASRAGWTVEKVHRYEGPILAEREHVAGLAQRARLRSRTSTSNNGATPTLSARVTERLKARDVEVTDASWDSWRSEGGPWTVVLTFAAGGRQRQASWSFNLADRTVSAVDDEARWLSEEVQTAKGPIPAPKRPVSGRETTVYDVEADGGLRPTTRDEHQDDPLDLMSAMRKRSAARGRRSPGSHAGPAKTASGRPGAAQHVPEQPKPPQNQECDPAPTPQGQPARDPSPADVSRRQDSRREPAAALIEFSDEGFGPIGTTPQQNPPDQESPQVTDQPQQPVEKPAKQSQSKGRTKGQPRETARKAGRPSVPAWDEIMFGSRPGADRST